VKRSDHTCQARLTVDAGFSLAIAYCTYPLTRRQGGVISPLCLGAILLVILVRVLMVVLVLFLLGTI